MADQGKALSLNDLNIMMQSYKNSVEMHTVILEQMKQLLDKMEDISTKQEDIIKQQAKLCDSMTKVSEQILKSESETGKRVEKEFEDVKEEITESMDSVKTKLDTHTTETIRFQGGVSTKFYIAFFGMIGIIGSMLTSFVTRYDTYSEVIRLLKMIAKKVGVQLD